jgi:hypothetical protein
MPPKHRDRVLLDPERFDKNTRTWNIPLLTVRGVSPLELFIDGAPIATGNYTVSGNHLTLGSDQDINADTTAHLVIQYNPTNMLVVFWLPVILAVIGILGSLGQPILHFAGVIYQPPMEIRHTAWGYDYKNHQFKLQLQAKNLSESDVSAWIIYVGVRKRDQSKDTSTADFPHVSGPFELRDIMTVVTSTNAGFTSLVATERATVEGAIFLVKRGISIAAPFNPKELLNSKHLRLLGAPGESIPDGAVLPSAPKN